MKTWAEILFGWIINAIVLLSLGFAIVFGMDQAGKAAYERGERVKAEEMEANIDKVLPMYQGQRIVTWAVNEQCPYCGSHRVGVLFEEVSDANRVCRKCGSKWTQKIIMIVKKKGSEQWKMEENGEWKKIHLGVD